LLRDGCYFWRSWRRLLPLGSLPELPHATKGAPNRQSSSPSCTLALADNRLFNSSGVIGGMHAAKGGTML
jgi:hypothetical protein